MQDDYIIKVVSRQTVEGEVENFEITTLASFEGTPDDYIISYTDEDEEQRTCKTSLHVENGRYITIRRDGECGSHIILEKEKRHISHHETPFGSFSMGVCAGDIRSTIKDSGGKLFFRYSTDVDMQPMCDIEFDITLSPRKRG